MGTGEESSPAKTSKATSTTQEAPLTPSYPDWSASMQAYYAGGATPPPFFASTVASPTPHPYLWGGQHLIPPYGTPVPYPALYPPGGVYAHPTMAMPPTVAHANMEMDDKTPEEKDRSSMKKSKSTSRLKTGESGKATSGSGNDGATPSAESGSEGSSDASDENTNHQESAANKKGSFDQMLADAGIGAVKMRTNPSGGSSAAVAGGVGREGSLPDHQWVQDERELKRQKRKQSNRESARRSRLRKQAECEELQARVETLSSENQTLRDELQKLSEECEKLTSENANIKGELTRVCGPDALSNVENGDSALIVQSCGGEGTS